MSFFFVGRIWGASRELPVRVLKRFKNGRCYVEFATGHRRNVPAGTVRLVA